MRNSTVVIPLPFRNSRNPRNISEFREIALRRFHNLERKLQNNEYLCSMYQ